MGKFINAKINNNIFISNNKIDFFENNLNSSFKNCNYYLLKNYKSNLSIYEILSIVNSKIINNEKNVFNNENKIDDINKNIWI